MIAREYVTEGYCTRVVLRHANVAESTFYYVPKEGKRGRTATNDHHGYRGSGVDRGAGCRADHIASGARVC